VILELAKNEGKKKKDLAIKSKKNNVLL